MKIRINNANNGEIEILEIENIQLDSSKQYYLDKELFEEIKKNIGVEIIEGMELYSINLSFNKVENEQMFLLHGYIDENAIMDERNIIFPISSVFFDNDEKNHFMTLRQYKI